MKLKDAKTSFGKIDKEDECEKGVECACAARRKYAEAKEKEEVVDTISTSDTVKE